MATNVNLITLTLLNVTASGLVVNQYNATKIILTDKEIINKIKIWQPYTPIAKSLRNYPRQCG